MGQHFRILFLADSHLGLDLPVRPRSTRRRRGHDFLANYARALVPALAGEVDAVVHGGDVFDRSRITPSLAYQAMEPLVRIAQRGIPVFVVPGNHERSRLPHVRFADHAGIHVFDRPRTYHVDICGQRIAFAGFPYERKNVRARFSELLSSTEWKPDAANASFLCIHHCVEGATVGPGNFVFTHAPDVIRGREIPAGFVAVLSGHIHRHQVLTRDLNGARLPAPVLYPGSIERTATAEIGERKGFLILDVKTGTPQPAMQWEFHELPARPMIIRELSIDKADSSTLNRNLRRLIAGVPADAVLSIRVVGEVNEHALNAFSARNLRTLVPATMNVHLTLPDRARWNRRPARRQPDAVLELPFPVTNPWSPRTISHSAISRRP